MHRILARSGLTYGIAPSAVRALMEKLHPVDLPSGHTVFAEGELGDRLYVIVAGTVTIGRTSPDGDEELLDVLGPSAIFGESSLFDPGLRTSTATTIGEVRLLTMDRDTFKAWLTEYIDATETPQ
jgi:CRP/FNR family transcriptional regulator, cyclic AMP receptor protein